MTLLARDTQFLSAAFSPDMKRLATAGDQVVVVWNIATGHKLRMLFTLRTSSLAWNPGGNLLATASYVDRPKVWDFEAKKMWEVPVPGDGYTRVKFSPTRELLAVTAHSQAIQQARNAASGQSVHSFGDLTPPIDAVAFSPDGRRIAFAGEAVTVRDVASGRRLSELRTLKDRAFDLTFSPDGQTLAVIANEGFAIWAWALGPKGWKQLPGSAEGSSVDGAFGVAFSADGKWLAGLGDKNTVRVWDAATGVQISSMFGPNSRVKAVAFNGDGKQLYAIAEDWALYRYPLQLNELVAEARNRLSGELGPSDCYEYLRIVPCPSWAQALALVAEGNKQARNMDVDGARASYRKAVNLDPALQFDPDEQLRSLAKFDPAVRVGWLTYKHRVNDAVAAYHEAQKQEPEPKIPSSFWNNTCWDGAVQGRAADVIDACDEAVVLAPEDENWNERDSRGLARAQIGNIKGAIDDFEFFISHTEDNGLKSQRQQWLKALRAGKNPFTAAELNKLRRRQ